MAAFASISSVDNIYGNSLSDENKIKGNKIEYKYKAKDSDNIEITDVRKKPEELEKEGTIEYMTMKKAAGKIKF